MTNEQRSGPYTWTMLAAVVLTVVVGLIVGFEVVDPCACRKDIATLRAQVDAQTDEIKQLYQDRAQ